MNTNAENGFFSSRLINTSLLFSKSIAFCGIESFGDGKHSTISSNNVFIPMTLLADPHITGAISPDEHPFINPSYISKSLNSPSLKYFSKSSSFVSATASIIICLHSSTLSISSIGISPNSIFFVLGLNIRALLVITLIIPLKVSSLPIGYCIGTTLIPNLSLS